jgi:hypothetical protein
MVLLVALFLETCVLIITSLAIYLWLGHRDHPLAIAYHRRLPQLREYEIIKTSSPRRLGVPSRFPTLDKYLT